jgi:hypothetical protein
MRSRHARLVRDRCRNDEEPRTAPPQGPYAARRADALSERGQARPENEDQHDANLAAKAYRKLGAHNAAAAVLAHRDAHPWCCSRMDFGPILERNKGGAVEVAKTPSVSAR